LRFKNINDMIIKRLILHNWKNFQEVDVDLSKRTFVVGANASGKSNFLDAIRFLRDICKQNGGGLQYAVNTVRGGIGKIRCLSAKKDSNIRIEVYLGNEDDKHPKWIYLLEFSQEKNKSKGIFFAKIISEKVFSQKENRWLLERPEKTEGEDEETLKFTFLEHALQNKSFRDIYNAFQQIEYLNVVPQLVRESVTYQLSKEKEDFYGRNFLERIAKKSEKDKKGFFNQINEVLKLAVPQFKDLEFEKDNNGIPHLRAKYLHWRFNGAYQTEEQFSDGTIRLIGFLWAVLDSNNTILLEEPEINLHIAIIKQLPEFISNILNRTGKNNMQVIITTHSYDLLDHLGINLEEVLLLENSAEKNATNVICVKNIEEVKQKLEAGFTIAEAIITPSSLKEIEKLNQIKLF